MSAQLMILPSGMWGAKSKKTRHFRDPNGHITHSGEQDEQFMNRTLDECAEFLLQRGVSDEEIDIAIQNMIANDHNVAEFGIFGKFVFSKFIGILH